MLHNRFQNTNFCGQKFFWWWTFSQAKVLSSLKSWSWKCSRVPSNSWSYREGCGENILLKTIMKPLIHFYTIFWCRRKNSGLKFRGRKNPLRSKVMHCIFVYKNKYISLLGMYSKNMRKFFYKGLIRFWRLKNRILEHFRQWCVKAAANNLFRFRKLIWYGKKLSGVGSLSGIFSPDRDDF